MEDPRPKIVASIELLSCRINFQPTIFLCGGLTDFTDPSIVTLRKALLENSSKFPKEIQDGILIAEYFKDYNADGLFPDLMTFENYLAGVAHSVVIILESAGTIAELGAFSQNPTLQNKLLVVCQDQYFQNGSFIELAILKYLSEKDEDSVAYYEWCTSDSPKPANIPEHTINHVIGDIVKFSRKSRSQKFSAGTPGHVIVFVRELIRLFIAVTRKEIQEYLTNVGIEIEAQELKRILYVLEKFEVIKQQVNGKTYFVPHRADFHSMTFGMKPGTSIHGVDIHRSGGLSTESVSMACSMFYQKSKDSRREGAITKALEGGLLK